MRRNNRQLPILTDTQGALTTLTDTSGSPSESYHWRQMAAVRREWQHEFWLPHTTGFEPSLTEISNLETQVRKELYP
jgi:hypothetical protein